MAAKKPAAKAAKPGKPAAKKAPAKSAAPKRKVAAKPAAPKSKASAAKPKAPPRPAKARPAATKPVAKPAAKPAAAKAAAPKAPPKPAAAKPARPAPARAAAGSPTAVTSTGGEHEPRSGVATPSFATRTPPSVVESGAAPVAQSRMAATSSDGDEESETGSSLSLLAGPRNVTPYRARKGEQYMSKEQTDHFRQILNTWKRDLMEEVDRTVTHMKDEAANPPDPNDRATLESEFSLELRTRDRERKLIRKIDEALKRIEDGSYGYCLETGEEIGVKRLEARPVATLSIEAQERRERREKQYGDRDDRYR